MWTSIKAWWNIKNIKGNHFLTKSQQFQYHSLCKPLCSSFIMTLTLWTIPLYKNRYYRFSHHYHYWWYVNGHKGIMKYKKQTRKLISSQSLCFSLAPYVNHFVPESWSWLYENHFIVLRMVRSDRLKGKAGQMTRFVSCPQVDRYCHW